MWCPRQVTHLPPVWDLLLPLAERHQIEGTNARTAFKALPHVTISPTISLTMPSSTMEFNEIVDDGHATRNDIVNDAGVK